MHEHKLHDIVYTMAAILSRPQYVNSSFATRWGEPFLCWSYFTGKTLLFLTNADKFITSHRSECYSFSCLMLKHWLGTVFVFKDCVLFIANDSPEMCSNVKTNLWTTVTKGSCAHARDTALGTYLLRFEAKQKTLHKYAPVHAYKKYWL